MNIISLNVVGLLLLTSIIVFMTLQRFKVDEQRYKAMIRRLG
ncbi:hypothetical protein [Paenibacillus silvae]|nr:hypothetical protein [Paenibacillus silvae]